MSDPQNLHIFQKSYAFTRWLLNHTNTFPKSNRFSVAVKMENTMLEILELMTSANMSRNKLKYLLPLDQKLAGLKILLRLSYDLKFVNITSYEYGARELVTIGKMLGGWMKHSAAS
ncbi:diversity-generating retroelement protein Avd [candidate division KSB1 bacterium]|nr:diversity-generating retroelement protein Avd [candidate division KSB1 bacterium]